MHNKYACHPMLVPAREITQQAKKTEPSRDRQMFHLGVREKSLKGRQLNGNMNRILHGLPSQRSLQAGQTVDLIMGKHHMDGVESLTERAIVMLSDV